MHEISDTKRLTEVVNAFILGITEIVYDKLMTMSIKQKETFGHRLPDAILNKKQLAEYYGVTVRTVENWQARGCVPYYKVGKNIRFRLRDVQAHWDEHFKVSRRTFRPHNRI